MTSTVLVRVACAVCGSEAGDPARIRPPKDESALRLGIRGGRTSWVVCAECGLVYQSPRPGPDDVVRLYLGGDYHVARGGVPEHYVAYSLRRATRSLAWALDELGAVPAPGAALDIGCGVGGALVQLRARGWRVTGVEPDPHLSSVARERFDVDVRTGFLDQTTFAAGTTFDFAYTCHVFEHLADPVATARVAHSLLEEHQGHLLIVVPTFRRARTLAWSCFTAPHTYMFTDVSLANVLHLAGFEVVNHRYDAASGDSELWLLARAVRRPASRPPVPEMARRIQRELSLVPLMAPLGLPSRAAVHLRTLRGNPSDFAVRAGRRVRARAAEIRRAITAR